MRVYSYRRANLMAAPGVTHLPLGPHFQFDEGLVLAQAVRSNISIAYVIDAGAGITIAVLQTAAPGGAYTVAATLVAASTGGSDIVWLPVGTLGPAAETIVRITNVDAVPIGVQLSALMSLPDKDAI